MSGANRAIPDNFKAMEIPKLPFDDDLPPLPIIENKDIERQVFTHTSVSAQARTRVNFSEGEEGQLDNEKLEWVGDGILSKSGIMCSLSSYCVL